MYVVEGVMRTADGVEVNLWGSNFQPNLYWAVSYTHLTLPTIYSV